MSTSPISRVVYMALPQENIDTIVFLKLDKLFFEALAKSRVAQRTIHSNRC